MKVYVIGNLKGGVGKTTTTVNLAYTYAEMGGRTLVIDLDPQCNCTRFFAKVNEYNKTIKDVLEAPEHINSAIYRTKYEDIDMFRGFKNVFNCFIIFVYFCKKTGAVTLWVKVDH